MAASHIKRNPDRDGEVAKDALAFTLTKAVDPSLLDAELSEAMNWRKDSGIVVDGDASKASKKTPVTVWFLRDDVDASTLRSVVADHEFSDIRTGNPMTAIREKAEQGEDFTEEDIQRILRELVLRQF